MYILDTYYVSHTFIDAPRAVTKQKSLSGWIFYFSRQKETNYATVMEESIKQGNLQCQKGEGFQF